MALLDIRRVSKRFGGLRAINAVDLSIDAGSIIFIVGPNGAGKTTLFNLITGVFHPDEGEIRFDGRDITAVTPDRAARLGIGRTFQIVKPLRRLTVLENVMLGAFLHTASRAKAADAARDVLSYLQMEQTPHQLAGALPLAMMKRLEIARALATRPKLILLDEVVAGLSTTEAITLAGLLKQLPARGVSAIGGIEHVMRVVMSIADRVVVLDQGVEIARGTPESIVRNQAVIEAYLGSQVQGAHPIADPLLVLDGVEAGYGELSALFNITLRIERGEIVTLVGANGAGKTTTLRVISGIVRARRGTIRFEGHDLFTLEPHEIVERGISHVPEGRQLFQHMSVEENLMLGAYVPRARVKLAQSIEEQFALFPRLQERRKQLAGTLSGGEQQMVAIARGLMAHPALLLLDEPSLGLAPKVVEEVLTRLQDIRRRGVTMLIVEQNVVDSLTISDRGYVIENGAIAPGFSTSASELLRDERLRAAYLGL